MVGTGQRLVVMSREVVTQIVDGVRGTTNLPRSVGLGTVALPPCPVKRRSPFSSGVTERVPAQVRTVAPGFPSSNQRKGEPNAQVYAIVLWTRVDARGSCDCSLPGGRSAEVRASLKAWGDGGISRNAPATSPDEPSQPVGTHPGRCRRPLAHSNPMKGA